MFDSLRQDVRYAVRIVGQNPLFALTAIVSLAIGIGANAAIFSVANALLLRPPAGIAQPSRVVDIGRTQDGQGFDTNSYPNYLDIQRRSKSLAGIYAYRVEPQPLSLGGGGAAERIYGSLVSANYFEVLGTRPLLGRFFVAANAERRGAAPFAVLNYQFWKHHFNSDPQIIGRTLLLNGAPFTIVAVAPEGFQGTAVFTADVWLPLSMIDTASPRLIAFQGADDDIFSSRFSAWLMLGGRLNPGVTLGQAQAELALLGQQLVREYPKDNEGRGLAALPLASVPGRTAPIALFLSLLLAIVALVLAIACINVAGVMLARAAARRREIAVRLALGARRRRLVRQLLTETSIFFVIGAATGLLLGRGLMAALAALMPLLPFPAAIDLTMDARVVAFVLTLTFAAAIISGIVPAFHATRTEIVAALKDAPGGAMARLRMRSAFVVGQVALSLLLVVAAGLFLRALQRAGNIQSGFDAHNVQLAHLDLSLAGYDQARGTRFLPLLLDRVRALPGVQAASAAAVLPLSGTGMGLGAITVPGHTPPGGARDFRADWNIVEPGYFASMGMTLIAGRDFDSTDRASTQAVAIINQTAANTFWPGESVIGKELLQFNQGESQPPLRLHVVGIARDTKYRSLDDEDRSFIFVPFRQQYRSEITLVVRTAAGPQVQQQLRRLVTSMDPNLPIIDAESFDQSAAFNLFPQRLAAAISGTLGFVGLLLATIGIYGVVAYAVTRRTREIGIRIALGASSRNVLAMILRQGLVLAGTGVLVGLALAAAASRAMEAFLFGLPAVDPVAFAGAAGLFALVAFAACWVPARRAAAIDAMQALRYE